MSRRSLNRPNRREKCQGDGDRDEQALSKRTAAGPVPSRDERLTRPQHIRARRRSRAGGPHEPVLRGVSACDKSGLAQLRATPFRSQCSLASEARCVIRGRLRVIYSVSRCTTTIVRYGFGVQLFRCGRLDRRHGDRRLGAGSGFRLRANPHIPQAGRRSDQTPARTRFDDAPRGPSRRG